MCASALRIVYAMLRALEKFLYLDTLPWPLLVKCACLRLLHLSHSANVVASLVLGKSKWLSCPERILVCLLQLQAHMSCSSSYPQWARSCYHWCCLLARLKQRHALFLSSCNVYFGLGTNLVVRVVFCKETIMR
jgi:hypothetical protein